MIRRTSLLLLEVLAALVAGLAILAGVAAWRVSADAPLRLSFLTPYLEQALTAPNGSFTVRIEDTVLTWAGWQRTLDLQASGVRVIGADGRQIAAVPAVAVTLSVRALLRGLVAPTAIEIFGPSVRLVREADGRFHFLRVDDTAAAPQEESPILPILLGELLNAADPDRATGYLTQASLVGGQLTFEDRRRGRIWHAPVATVELRRDDVGIVGRLDLEIEELGRPARVRADLTYDPATATVAFVGGFSDVDLAALGHIEPALGRFAGGDLKLAGRLATSIGLDGRIGASRFDMVAGPGRIVLPDIFDDALAVRRLSLRGRLDPGGDRLTLETAVIDLDGLLLTIAGSIDGLLLAGVADEGDMVVAGHLVAGNVAVADLDRFWPRGAAPGARRWVTRNMVDGTVERIEVEIGLRLPGGIAQETRVETLDGTLSASALTIHYFRPLPPIRGAVGTARFNAQEFVAEFGGGGVEAIEIESGRIRIGGLDQPDARFDIDGTLRGPLRDALQILDHPRFGYVGRFGIDPTTTAGAVAMRLSIAFDDRADTTIEDLRFEAEADVTDAELGKAMFGYSVADADLAVTVNNDALTVDGAARINGVPTQLSWTENFGDADLRSEITLSGEPDADQIAALGLDVRRFLDGPVGTELVHRRFADDSASLDASFDLAAAALDLPLIEWHKAAGEVGAANLELDLEGGRPVAVPEFTVAAGSLAATGRARFAIGGKALADIEFDSLAFGESRLQDVAAQFADDRVTVTIGGGRFDATSLLKAEASKESRRPFALTAERLDWVMLGPDRGLEDVSLSARHDGRFWDEFALDAMLPGRQGLTVRYLPAPAGKRRLSVVANDAGAALSAFGIVDTVVGGRLSIVAEAADDEPGRPLRGTVEISRFRLVRAPTVARVLSVAALTGLIDVLTGDGLLFSRFTAEFVKTGDKMEVVLARAYGPSLGFTATGEVDFAADTFDLEGTIVPAYALNSILGNIPIIGNLLQGGKGEGLFAATYTLTGPQDDPKVTVNPLAALAPGFLRALFDMFDGGDAGKAVAPTALPDTGNRK